MSNPNAKPYAEIRDWTNVSTLTVTIGKKTVAPGKTFKGEAPRHLIRSGVLRPTVKKAGGKK